MFKRRLPVVFLAAALLVSCNKDDDASKNVIKLSSDEVSALLGIKEKDGIKIGEIESGPNGVKVKSISLKENDSTEVEIQDVELRITSPSKLVYAISYLKIAKLDILDWKSSQRAQAFAVVVEKPGDGFLSKLNTAIASTKSSGSLKTADLSCERLGIERLDYAAHGKDNATSVRLEELSISQVTTEKIGELRLGSAGIGAKVAGKGLRVTNVDRRWADQILARLVTFQGPEDNPTSQPNIAQPYPTTKPVVAKIELPSMGKRVLPLDSLEVAELNFAVGNSAKGDQAPFKITSVRLDVQRKPDGALAGVQGTGNVIISPAGLANTDTEKREFHAFFARFNPKLEQAISITTTLKMTVDSAQDQEQTEIASAAPGVITIAASGTTRGVAKLIGELIADRELRDESWPTISALKLELRDNGLLAYLLSDRFEYHDTLREVFTSTPFQLQNAGDDDRLRKELRAFMRAAGAINFDAQCGTFTTFTSFFVDVFAGFGAKPGPAAMVKTRISCTGATAQPAAFAPSMDIGAGHLEFKKAFLLGKESVWLTQRCLDQLDGWMQAANAGNSSARVLVGACYQHGLGIRRNEAEALRLFHQAADTGDTLAAMYIGDAHHLGGYGVTKDHAAAMRWYQIAASAGDTRAMLKIGMLYDGYRYDDNEPRYGVAKDYAQAMAWFRKSADAGNAEAMEQVGNLYRDGKGVETSNTDAFNWHLRAADAGRANCMVTIAYDYVNGTGVGKNMPEARRWFQRAADAGDYFGKKWLTEHPN